MDAITRRRLQQMLEEAERSNDREGTHWMREALKRRLGLNHSNMNLHCLLSDYALSLIDSNPAETNRLADAIRNELLDRLIPISNSSN